jgi:chitodextrinase
MSKKKAPRKAEGTTASKRKKGLVVTALALTIALCFVTLAGPWSNSPGVKGLRSLFVAPPAPPPLPAPGNPSKEYIYAGGKLIATEEPLALLAPANMMATTLSNLVSPQVSIAWSATAGADHYQVEKTNNVLTAYSIVNSNVVGTAFTDNSVTSVTAYLYRVRAVDSVGNLSPPSNVDLATAISFTDDSLVINSTVVKAAHINELRQTVDAVRATANQGLVNWGGSISPNVTIIQATHIQDLRTNLDQARSALGLSPCSYTDPSVEQLRTVRMKKEHIDQLRQCVK